MCRPGPQCTPRDLGTHLECPPSPGRPQLLAQTDPRPEHTLEYGREFRIIGIHSLHPQPRHTLTPPRRARQTPQGGPHAQTRTQPPARSPASQPGMPWEAEAGPCRGAAATGLKGKCFLNEIKRGLFSRAWWCPENPAQGCGD